MISVRRSLSPAGKSLTSRRSVSAVSNWKLQIASLTRLLTAASCEATTANPAPTATSTMAMPMSSARRRLFRQIFSCRTGRPHCGQRRAPCGSSAWHSRHCMYFSPLAMVAPFLTQNRRNAHYSRFRRTVQAARREKHRKSVRNVLRKRSGNCAHGAVCPLDIPRKTGKINL